MKKLTRKNILITIIIVILFAVLLLVLGKFNYKKYYTVETRIDKINSTTIVDAKALGWLRVQGTDIDTPIVEATDAVLESLETDYLWTSYYYHEGENRKVIYGHNIRNVTSEPEIRNSEHIRFEQLMSFVYYDFAKENLYIQYSDGKEEKLYKIYAVAFSGNIYEYGQSYSKEEVSEYIINTREESIYDYNVDVDENDELISLITCTRYFGIDGKTQFKVDARRVRENEKITKYSVEINANYDIIK